MSTKLWQTSKSPGLHPIVEAYTVGDDYLLDQELLGYDIQASKAHAAMLHATGFLTDQEALGIGGALDELYRLWSDGTCGVTAHQEDGHTAIEAYLVEKPGAAGKKIHTARSRNDQALVMMRLYLKDHLYKAATSAAAVSDALQAAAARAGNAPMPGYTHMQKAMPTTVSTWLGSYADGFADAAKLAEVTVKIVAQNPLGSAAGV